MINPFGDLIRMHVTEQDDGTSRCTLDAGAQHYNGQKVVHGGALYTLVDTGMAAALYPSLKPGEICATIDTHISYFKPVVSGLLVCDSRVINRGKRVAHLESTIQCAGVLIARATGNFSILVPSTKTAT